MDFKSKVEKTNISDLHQETILSWQSSIAGMPSDVTYEHVTLWLSDPLLYHCWFGKQGAGDGQERGTSGSDSGASQEAEPATHKANGTVSASIIHPAQAKAYP